MVTRAQIKDFPDSPGVYLMKDAEGRVIYVGKAVSLRKRLRTYFGGEALPVKTRILMRGVRSVEVRETRGEHEALLLESELIKELRPRFNISLKDDKSFPYIKVTRERFPRVTIGRRRHLRDDADYFGPYTNAKVLRQALGMLRRSFPFCSCRRFPRKVCLNYHLGLCPGPCAGKVSEKKYRRIIGRLEDFLLKKDTPLIEELAGRMRRLVARQRFEEAGRLRDQLQALSLLISLKKLDADKDVFAETDFRKLGLRGEPRRVEAFDISNIAGDQAVGSLVTFAAGRPRKDGYRRFRIKTVSGIDDYAMMREVVRRRYRRLLEENGTLPDLVLIDGGRGHWEAARGVLESLGLKIPLIAIAKNEELLYTRENAEPVRLDRASPALHLIQRVRDEAHRFAVAYHRLLRKKKSLGVS